MVNKRMSSHIKKKKETTVGNNFFSIPSVTKDLIAVESV